MPRRCALGCPPNTRGSLHAFPNPDKYPEQHKAWVKLVTGNSDCDFDYKKYRVCDRHFTETDRTRSSRLNILAVPSLFLPEVTTFPSGSLHSQSRSMEVSLNVECPTMNMVEGMQPSQIPNIVVSPMKIDYQDPSTDCSPCMQSRTESPKPGCSFTNADAVTLDNTNPVVLPSSGYCLLLDHNYCASSKSQVVRRQRVSKTNMAIAAANKYKSFQTKINNLRREVYRQRKKSLLFKTRLENAERQLKEPAVQQLANRMTMPAKIFTLMQFNQTYKNKKGRRFTIDEKILSLSLYKKSPKCYGLMAKLFTLPSGKSLRRLLSKVKIGTGTNNHLLFDNLKKQVEGMNTENRLCSLIFDEMSISPQIHFNASTDEIKGLVSNGKKNIANHALVFMVKGLRKPFKQPVAYYFTNSINRVDLKKMIVEVITKVIDTGLIIVCTVCDQSTINVSAINELVHETRSRLLRKCIEMKNEYFSINSKKIIPLYDTPHIIKGLRNNLITKNLKYFDFEENKEKVVKWEFFEQVYWADKSFGELRCLLNLTEEHIVPEKIKKMRVKTATQIFSHSVAATTNHLSAREKIPQECTNLINFVLIIDNLFDSLNVSNFNHSKGKVYKEPVRRNSPHHELWKKSIQMLKTVRFIKNTTEFIPPSVKNFIKTIEGFQSLWKVLSEKYSFDCMLTRNMNQDPVENFFGNIRSYGARNIAPDCVAFEGAYKSLLLNNYNSPQSSHANCESDNNICLQNLNFFFKEAQSQSSYIADERETEKDVPLREEIINVIEKDIEDNGQRNYVCGWVLKKILVRIVKQCRLCKNDLISKSDNKQNSYVKAKEYCKKNWLCYPSLALVKYFQEIQNICVSSLKRDVPNNGIKKYIKFYVDIFLMSPFKCEKHKEKLKSFFVDTTINILIYSWCRNVNRILSGKMRNNDVTDELKVMAQIYYDKHKHYKVPK